MGPFIRQHTSFKYVYLPTKILENIKKNIIFCLQ